MSDFLAMGGYGGYVWTAYAVFFIVLVFDAVSPVLQKRRTLRELRGRLRRAEGKRSRPG